jgi:hypothetical protein
MFKYVAPVAHLLTWSSRFLFGGRFGGFADEIISFLLAETQLHEMQVEEWIEGMDRSISHLAS